MKKITAKKVIAELIRNHNWKRSADSNKQEESEELVRDVIKAIARFKNCGHE